MDLLVFVYSHTKIIHQIHVVLLIQTLSEKQNTLKTIFCENLHKIFWQLSEMLGKFFRKIEIVRKRWKMFLISIPVDHFFDKFSENFRYIPRIFWKLIKKKEIFRFIFTVAYNKLFINLVCFPYCKILRPRSLRTDPASSVRTPWPRY